MSDEGWLDESRAGGDKRQQTRVDMVERRSAKERQAIYHGCCVRGGTRPKNAGNDMKRRKGEVWVAMIPELSL